MGWKTVNGHRYYYRSKRDGDRVRTEYVGTGDFAVLCTFLDAEDRAARADERAEIAEANDQDREVQEWFDRVERVAEAALFSAGFHRHNRGNWRRRRDDE